MNKKVVFFDVNGTLVDQKASFRTAFQGAISEFLGRWHLEPGIPQLEDVYEQYESEWHKQKKALAGKRTKSQNEQCQLTALRHALSTLPFDLNDVFMQRLLARIKELQTSSPVLYSDVTEMLDNLSRKYELAIISNSPSLQIGSSILQNYFPPTHIFTSHTERSTKPDRSIFLKALSKMKVKPSEAVMIGDSWKRDILGATKVGIDAIWLNRRAPSTDNRHTNLNAQPLPKQKRIGRKPIPVIQNCKQLLHLL